VTLRDALRARAVADPERPAIVSPGQDDLSAQDLVTQLDAVAAMLTGLGISAHDRVIVVAGLGPEAAIAMLGAAGAATCIPLSPAAGAELDSVLEQTGARAILAPGEEATIVRAADDPAVHAPPRPDDPAFILRTSGTTSRPKLVPATHRQLLARAEAAGDFLRLAAADRCYCPMPLCYGHGLYTGLLFPLLTGGSAILPAEFGEASALEALGPLGATWYTAGSSHQHAILDWVQAQDARTPRLRFARCASSALPEGLREELEAQLGVPVLETYGTSETGMIASPDPHGPRREGTAGVATGVEIAIANGEIVVRGPTVFDGYDGDPELTARSFDGEWFRTGDRGSLDRDGFLRVDGRVDDVINRGGEKVSPAEVEAVLLGHPGVAGAAVFGVAHPSLQQEVAAAVAAEPGHTVDAAALRTHAATRLAPFKVPRRVVIVPELPVGPTGKVIRGRLEGLLPEAAPNGAAMRHADMGPVEARLAGCWAEALELGSVGLDDDFFDSGGDSLAAVELLAAIEQELRVEVSLEDLASAPTPRLLARTMLEGRYLENHSTLRARDTLSMNVGGTARALFVVGGRPGYALRGTVMAREVSEDLPVHGLQPPDMDWHAAGRTTIPEMAAHYVERVCEIEPDGPHRLLGSSFGGLIVFEMARQLEAAGRTPRFVGLVDTEPPRMTWQPEAGTLPYALEDLDAPATLSGSIADAGERVAAAHIEARRSYAAASPLGSGLTLFYCASEGVVAGGDRRRLWAEATTSDFRLVELPGLHARFDREPQFSAIRDSLRSCLLGEPPAGQDPRLVFDRSYTLTGALGQEEIHDGEGSSFRVEPGAMRGQVRAARPRRGKVLVRGWASDAEGRQPGDTVVVFVDGAYAGYSTCGAPSDGGRRSPASGVRHAGFRLRLDPPAEGLESEPPRVFALSPGGTASELQVTAQS